MLSVSRLKPSVESIQHMVLQLKFGEQFAELPQVRQVDQKLGEQGAWEGRTELPLHVALQQIKVRLLFGGDVLAVDQRIAFPVQQHDQGDQ